MEAVELGYIDCLCGAISSPCWHGIDPLQQQIMAISKECGISLGRCTENGLNQMVTLYTFKSIEWMNSPSLCLNIYILINQSINQTHKQMLPNYVKKRLIIVNFHSHQSNYRINWCELIQQAFHHYWATFISKICEVVIKNSIICTYIISELYLSISGRPSGLRGGIEKFGIEPS